MKEYPWVCQQCKGISPAYPRFGFKLEPILTGDEQRALRKAEDETPTTRRAYRRRVASRQREWWFCSLVCLGNWTIDEFAVKKRNGKRVPFRPRPKASVG